MTQERIMFSNPSLSKPCLSAAATMSDATPSALTQSWHCASILQPAAPLQVVDFESHPICLNYLNPFPFLVLWPPSHPEATTLSPCWASHFMTQERIMFSNPSLSKPHLSPAATMSDATPSALTQSLHCASILQPAAPLQVVAFES